MLEFYEDNEEAEKVLNDYAYDNTFPPNPNAHVYLYQYLKRHDTPEKKSMKVLKVKQHVEKVTVKHTNDIQGLMRLLMYFLLPQILQTLVPSHELMLEYSSFLLQSGKSRFDILTGNMCRNVF